MSYTHLRPSQGREAIRSQILGGSVGNTSSRPINGQHESPSQAPPRCLSLSHRSQGIRTYRNMSYTHLRPSQGREAIRSQILGGSVGNTSSRPINGQHESPSQAPPSSNPCLICTSQSSSVVVPS
ncbi:hypothetical protein F2Q68_00018150 [Brassica cretica]|uniref:Uncharacterized protein n=1 Tax=Brassica cretica TaxID=69181 RepID=A0A8S9HLJ6_BRACR|nr:hypothetical protein F2Q68_00018150 [Brassica cretica]